MRYFDTSFLAPLILEEATSGRVESFLARLRPGEMAISHWTRVELASLLAREVRMGGLESQEATKADTQFEAVVRESFLVLLPDAADFDQARIYLHKYATGLRAGDALHLAIAYNHRSEVIYSLDRRLLAAGRLLNLPVSMGIRLPR